MQSKSNQKYATLGHYVLASTIGKGGYAKVKIACCYFTREIYAIKIFKKSQANFSSNLVLEEAQRMNLITHDKVPAIFEFYESVPYVKKNGQKYEVAAIVMEHVQNGDIYDYLVASQGGFPEEIARTMFRSLIETIGDIHEQGIAHRDIKIENLLFDKDFNLKIGDFGLAAKFKNEKGLIPLKDVCGTISSMAPEILSQNYYNGAVIDVFSCGVILFTLMAGHPPFHTANPYKDPFYGKIAKKNYNAFWEVFEKQLGKTYSDEFKDLVNSMLAMAPSERPTIEKIKEHPWFTGPVLNSEEMNEALGGLKQQVDVIRLDNRQKEKEKAAQAKAMLKKMQEEKFSAPRAFTGVFIKK